MCVCVCVYSIEIHFKGLAETIVGVGKPEILRAGQQAGTLGNSWGSLESEMDSVECKLNTEADFYITVLRMNFFFPSKP